MQVSLIFLLGLNDSLTHAELFDELQLNKTKIVCSFILNFDFINRPKTNKG